MEGLDEEEIFIGDVFQIGEAQIQVTQPRQPCFKLGVRFGTPKMVRQFIDSGFPGVYFRVLKKGKVKSGDEFQLLETKPEEKISIQKVFKLLYTDEFQKDEVTKAINNPRLAQSCRKDLLKRWGKYL